MLIILYSFNGSTVGSRVLTGSFGKLNAQKVRSLARTTSQKKQDTNGRVYDEKNIQDDPFDGSVSSKFEPESSVEDKGLDVTEVRKIISRATQSRETRDRKQRVETGDDMNHSEVAIKHGVEQPSNRPRNFQQPNSSVPVSRSSTSSMRGWSNGGSAQNSRYEPTEILKKWSKSNNDSDFFSRKSFRDMGCSDYMIEALKRGFLSRPSHIQVSHNFDHYYFIVIVVVKNLKGYIN